MAQFEKAATVGVVVVVALSAIIIHKAVTLGFPAVRDGELPLFSLRVGRGRGLRYSRGGQGWREEVSQWGRGV